MKRRPVGRGVNFSIWQALGEAVCEVAYVADWPARLWGALPFAREPLVTRKTLPAPLAGGTRCRIALISDLHAGPTTPPALLERTFEILRDARPDVLILGGDYVFLDALPHRLELLRDLIHSVPPLSIRLLDSRGRNALRLERHRHGRPAHPHLRAPGRAAAGPGQPLGVRRRLSTSPRGSDVDYRLRRRRSGSLASESIVDV